VQSDERYPINWTQSGNRLEIASGSVTGPANFPRILDWQPWLAGVLEDQRLGLPVGLISAKFHNSLVAGICDLARQAAKQSVVLSGGCFQNKYLTERAVAELRRGGFQPYWHHWIPPNDGGIALGQVVAARRVRV
jgi:hydrogenase maturation protein HypF